MKTFFLMLAAFTMFTNNTYAEAFRCAEFSPSPSEKMRFEVSGDRDRASVMRGGLKPIELAQTRVYDLEGRFPQTVYEYESVDSENFNKVRVKFNETKRTVSISFDHNGVIPPQMYSSDCHSIPGSACALIESADELDSYTVKEKVFIHKGKRLDRQASNLKALERRQLIITALWLKEKTAADDKINSAKEAILSMINNGGQADISVLKINQRLFSMVRGYPGDNAMGFIFESGSTKPMAEIHDSEVVCR